MAKHYIWLNIDQAALSMLDILIHLILSTTPWESLSRTYYYSHITEEKMRHRQLRNLPKVTWLVITELRLKPKQSTNASPPNQTASS